MRSYFNVFGSVCIWLFAITTVRAELVVIEPFVASLKNEFKAELGDSTVVVSVRQVGRLTWPWSVHEALATEITAALRADGIDAITAASDHRIESLAEPNVEFAASDARRVKTIGRVRLLTGSLSTAGSPKLKMTIWNSDTGGALWKKEFKIPTDVLDLQANVPPLNRKVVTFCRENFDKQVGNGICAELASEALAAAGAKRSGVYTWGRELDDREPILPGDILQMELIQMKAASFSRSFRHHTAVVEEVHPDAIVVLHQNVGPKGRIVQRDIWPLASFRRGYLVAFRPWHGSSSLPPVSPRRRMPPSIVKMGSSIDLLRTINPRLDSVKGIWFIEEGTLRPNRDDWARLQVPVVPPDEYTLSLKVQRLFGKDQFAVGLIVGGKQTMMSFDAYGGTVSGLHLVDAKTVKNNVTTYRGAVLPEGKTVSLRIQVTPTTVTSEADGKVLVNWEGNSAQLSQDEKYSIPRQDWLYLASWNSHFSISEFLLDNDRGSGKTAK